MGLGAHSDRVVHGADVVGYSIIKGHFLNQTGPDELVSDPLFGFSVLGGVDLTDLDLLNSVAIHRFQTKKMQPHSWLQPVSAR